MTAGRVGDTVTGSDSESESDSELNYGDSNVVTPGRPSESGSLPLAAAGPPPPALRDSEFQLKPRRRTQAGLPL